MKQTSKQPKRRAQKPETSESKDSSNHMLKNSPREPVKPG